MKRMSKDLNVGRLVYVRSTGQQGEIIAGTKKQWIVAAANSFCNGVAYNKRDVEPLITELFQVGDLVSSHYNFCGTVTGFEIENNRVVAISDRNLEPRAEHCDRVRYAYLYRELNNLGTMPAFKLNRVYNVEMADQPQTLNVRVLENPTNPELYSLHAVRTGRFLFSVDRELMLSSIFTVGLRSVREVK